MKRLGWILAPALALSPLTGCGSTPQVTDAMRTGCPGYTDAALDELLGVLSEAQGQGLSGFEVMYLLAPVCDTDPDKNQCLTCVSAVVNEVY